jgi:hypothetical protein
VIFSCLCRLACRRFHEVLYFYIRVSLYIYIYFIYTYGQFYMQGYFHFAEFSSRNVLNELRMICGMSGIDSFFRNSVR